MSSDMQDSTKHPLDYTILERIKLIGEPILHKPSAVVEPLNEEVAAARV